MTTETTTTKFFIINALVAILAISAFAYYSYQRFHAEEVKGKQEVLEKCIRTMHEFLRPERGAISQPGPGKGTTIWLTLPVDI